MNVNINIVNLYLPTVLNRFINFVLSLNNFSSRKKVNIGTNIPSSVKAESINNTSLRID